MIETKPDTKDRIDPGNLKWEAINEATREIHKAVQWIGRVENAYNLQNSYDGSPKMHWDSQEGYFYGNTLEKKPIKIGFRPEEFQWLLLEKEGAVIDTLSGLGRSDEDMWAWLQRNLIQREIPTDNLRYDLKYSLAYDHGITSIYTISDKQALALFPQLRSLGIRMIKAALLFSRPRTMREDINTWLHNFDSCSNIPLYQKDEKKNIGVGMAQQDGRIGEYYLYVRNWAKQAVFNSNALPGLPSGGYWLSNDGWNAAVLPFSKLIEDNKLQLDRGVLFLIGAIETLIDF